MNWVVLAMAMVKPAGSAAAPLAVQTPLVTLPGVQLVIFRSLLITEVGGVVGGVTGVLTEVSLPVESNDMVEAIGALTLGSLPSGLRPSIRV
ncbi:hypothetical protein D3C84_856910 [compost metagenome]